MSLEWVSIEEVFKYLRSNQRAARGQLREAYTESEEAVRSFGVEVSEVTGGRSEWCLRAFLGPGQRCFCPSCAGEREREIRAELHIWAETISAWAVASGLGAPDTIG